MSEHQSINIKFRVGDCEGYFIFQFTSNCEDDYLNFPHLYHDQVCGVDIYISKQDESLKGAYRVIANLINGWLKTGGRIRDVCDVMRGQSFQPSGPVMGHNWVAGSILDHMARIIEEKGWR